MTGRALNRYNAWAAIRKRAKAAGFLTPVGCHTWRATGITSVIRTADGSEIIAPNGSLISSQVTNWTFSDRKRAIEISVNVVGGTDPQRVVELLKSTAAGYPGVAKEPAPQVYVTSFSAGSVTFQLRAWTDRHEDWAQLHSDLSVAVNDALSREKIPIA